VWGQILESSIITQVPAFCQAFELRLQKKAPEPIDQAKSSGELAKKIAALFIDY
jgi:hypothetical protein